ncbi:MAG: DUF5928 domain-containing protein [Pseudomonadota bacterium]
MAKIAFILLCHKNPEGIIAQTRGLIAAGDYVAIHFDARAPKSAYAQIRAAFAEEPSVTFTRRRVRCGWGHWSLVQATLNALKAALNAFPRATHFYMLSGDCMAIKTAEHGHRVLDALDADFIESFDFFESDWIKTGLKGDRLHYRHHFNERNQSRLFYTSFNLQKRLGLKRDVPKDLRIMIGSQWWCLRRLTVEAVLDFCRKRPDIVRFFRTTWIPDETFFQTLVRHLVPSEEIESRTLTFLMFSDYGMPVTFYNDHYNLLLSQDFLFARKISPEAKRLRKKLAALYARTGITFSVSGEGPQLYRFLTARGRIGQRFAPRFWEADAQAPDGRTLMVVTCKKWHVAKRLLAAVRQVSNVPTLEYIFNEEAAPMPDLGGVQTTLEKRTRHRRALLNMLFDYYGTDQLILCLDPSDHEFIADVAKSGMDLRVLEIECAFSDDYLIGHARRVGLAGETTSEKRVQQLLPAIRNDIIYESRRLKEAQYPAYVRLRQEASPEENAPGLAAFLDTCPETAKDICKTDHLFVD